MSMWDDTSRVGRADPSDQTDPGRNRAAILRVALVTAFTLFLASFAPAGLFLFTWMGLLQLGAMVAAVAGLVERRPLRDASFTRWDEAAALYVISFGAGAFVDPQVVEAARTAAGV